MSSKFFSLISASLVLSSLLLLSVGLTNPAQAAVSFASVVNYPVGTFPWAVISGDFNGDGNLDLAAANEGTDNVSLLLGNGDGTFTALATTFAVGTDPRALISGDFNGDGHLDLAVANFSSDNVSILLGKGDGTFQPAVSYGAGDGPRAIIVGDFDGDGKVDLAVANYNSNNVSILRGNGDGTFQAAVNYPVGSNPAAITTGDFNGNGQPDLATANWGLDNVSILLGNGTGTFQAAVNYNLGIGTDPLGIATGDFSFDGKLDLAVADSFSNNVSILLGKGDGTFTTPATTFPVGNNPYSVAVGDFNGDGKPDLAVANSSSNNVSLLLGKGDGTFTIPATTFAVGSGPRFVTSADFNADGKLDLATANYATHNVSVLLNTSFIDVTVSPASKDFGEVAVGGASLAQTFTITNNGATSLTINSVTVNGTNSTEFIRKNDGASGATLLPSESRTLQVEFHPASAGLKSAYLDISTDSSNLPHVWVSLSGTGSAANISVTPTSHDFGPVEAGSSSPAQTFTITNTGAADLIIGTITITGTNAAEFPKGIDNASNHTIAPSASLTVDVAFSPTTGGAKNASLKIPSNDPDTPNLNVSLTGTGLAPVISVSPTSLTFPDTKCFATSPPQTLIIKNIGDANLTITGAINLTGNNPGEFNIASMPPLGTVIAPSGTQNVVLEFKPTTVGSKSAILNIPSDDPATSNKTVNLTGTGIPRNIAVNPAIWNFGAIPLSTTATKTFAVKNTGTTPLTITGLINLTGPDAAEFSILSAPAPGTIIAPSTQENVVVAFNPTTQGSKSAVLNIPSDDPDLSNFEVSLSGASGQFFISGTVKKSLQGFGGVTVSLTGTFSNTATTDANGFYSFNNLPAGTYIITPSITGYLFIPKSKTVTLSASKPDITQNFSAYPIPTYGVSGKVRNSTGTPISWITLTLTDGTNTYTKTADMFGGFAFRVPNGSWTLTPNKCGFDFTPPSYTLNVNNFSYSGLVFILSGTFPRLIHGRVTKPNKITGIAGVTVTLSGGCNQTVTTDLYGKYYFRVSDGNYTVTPSHGADTFTPSFVNVTVSGGTNSPPNPVKFTQP